MDEKKPPNGRGLQPLPQVQKGAINTGVRSAADTDRMSDSAGRFRISKHARDSQPSDAP